MPHIPGSHENWVTGLRDRVVAVADDRVDAMPGQDPGAIPDELEALFDWLVKDHGRLTLWIEWIADDLVDECRKVRQGIVDNGPAHPK